MNIEVTPWEVVTGIFTERGYHIWGLTFACVQIGWSIAAFLRHEKFSGYAFIVMAISIAFQSYMGKHSEIWMTKSNEWFAGQMDGIRYRINQRDGRQIMFKQPIDTEVKN